MTPEMLAGVMAQYQLTRGHILLVILFARGHEGLTFAQALANFLHGEGPAAVAAGRSGVRALRAARPAWLREAERAAEREPAPVRPAIFVLPQPAVALVG